jgi:hypothetical protein
MEKIQGSDPEGFSAIKKVIDRLLDNPSLSDGPLHGDKKGQFKKYVGRDRYRLSYTWCAKCKESGVQEKNVCNNYCDILPHNSVIFIDAYPKKDFKKLGY